MRNYNFLFIIVLSFFLVNCAKSKKEADALFNFNDAILKAQYEPNESITLDIVNPNNEKIDSIAYYIGSKKIGVAKAKTAFVYSFKDEKLGNQDLKASIYFNGEYSESTYQIELVSNIQPKLINYKIINTYPHDSKAYTQGLEFYRDTLYEGTGNGAGPSGMKGVSSLRKTNYKTGEVYKKVELADDYFGEGITVFKNKVYQLTWLNNEGYIYNADTFKKEKTFAYFKKIEGWGLTNDGGYLYLSDGTEKIWKLDPKTLKEVDYINVYSYQTKIKSINELEWINGKIYGNVYQKDAIAIINPKNGAVEGIVNLIDLKTKITQLPDNDVLNGIAYNPATKTIFVTGKNWDKLFEIKLVGVSF